MHVSEDLENLPIGEVKRRAAGGDAGARAVLEAFAVGGVVTAPAVRAIDVFMRPRIHDQEIQAALHLKNGAAAAIRAMQPVKIQMSAAVQGIGLPKRTADVLERLDRRDALLNKRLARLVVRILGKVGRQRFVSHLPSRGRR